MYRGEEINAFIDKNKAIIWGLFLSTIIFKFAVSNIFFGILAVFFLFQLIKNRKIILHRSLIPVVIYFFWGVASLFWTTNISNTVSGISLTLPFLFIPLFISQYSYFGVSDLKKIVQIFSSGLLLYFLICYTNSYLEFLKDNKLGHFFYHDLVSIFDNNAIYISLAVAICILITFLFAGNSIKDYLIIFCLAIFLVLLSSKNIIITTFLLMLITVFFKKNNLKYIFIISCIVSIIAFLIVILENPIKNRFLAELHLNIQYVWHGQDFFDYKFTGSEVRLFQWRVMAEMIQNNQVGMLGLGLHNVDYLIDQYFSYYNLYKGYFFINFHNQYLQTLGELGFIGLFFLMLLFVWSIYKAFRFRNKYEILIILLFMVAFFTESFLSRQKGVYLFAIIYSLISVLSISTKKSNDSIGLKAKA